MNALSNHFSVSTVDGIELRGTVFDPVEAAQATVLFAGGVGVPQRVYRPFAEWLAARGFRCVTFDYRGTGSSRNTPSATKTASLTAWAKRDVVAVFEHIERCWQAPVVLIAHSFGGQLLALAEPLQRLHAAVLIASQCGTSKYWTGWQRCKISALWHLVLPVVSRLGAVSPKWTGMRLPAGVAREWGLWGRQADWLFSLHPDAEPRLGKFPAPVLAYCVADDELAPPAAVAALIRRFNPQRVRTKLLDSVVEQEQIGHHGVFRSGLTPQVWNEVFGFLVEQLADAGALNNSVALSQAGLRAHPSQQTFQRSTLETARPDKRKSGRREAEQKRCD